MELAGVPIGAAAALELAVLLRDAGFAATSETIEAAYADGRSDVALAHDDKEAILRVLDPPAHQFAELHGVLLHEHEERLRDAGETT